jgi:hypothetical protein
MIFPALFDGQLLLKYYRLTSMIKMTNIHLYKPSLGWLNKLFEDSQKDHKILHILM